MVSESPGILCEAAHLLAHSKSDSVCILAPPLLSSVRGNYCDCGSIYKTYTECRSRDPHENDIVTEIDSVRNGLYLHGSVHKCLGKKVAFLKVREIPGD
jgi:HNH endonuclease